VRQPEVARLLPLLLALVLVTPVALAAQRWLLAGAFLTEFISGGRLSVLTGLTAEPRRQALRGAVLTDRYAARQVRTPVPLVLVHGFASAGKDDRRAGHAARLLARAGFDVLVPSLPGLMQGRLRPSDAEPVVTAIEAARDARSVSVIAVSIGAGPALLAAADPRVRHRVAMVVTVGGYASAHELLRFFLTGDFAWGDVRGHVDHDPEIVRLFVAANADLVDEPTRRAIEDGDRARIAAFLAAPPADLRRLLEALSPVHVAADVPARLLLIHGRGDRAVPYTESLRLAAARRGPTTVALLGTLGHVEGADEGVRRWGVQDFLTLWLGLYALASAT